MSISSITGGCQCGAVRYAITGPLGRASICHCRMCQKAFGSFYGPLVSVPSSAFQLTRGAIASFRSSDLAERGFCRDCGTPLTFRYIDGGETEVSIGSLDHPEQAKPAIQYWRDSAMPWLYELESLPVRQPPTGDAAQKLAQIARTSRQHPDHDTESWPGSERP